jgi:hypothetical protein
MRGEMFEEEMFELLGSSDCGMNIVNAFGLTRGMNED